MTTMIGATDYAGIGTALVGLAAVITAVSQISLRGKVAAIHDEVKMGNGETLGEAVSAVRETVEAQPGCRAEVLLEQNEARRVIADVPEADRTEAERAAVEALENDGDRCPPPARVTR